MENIELNKELNIEELAKASGGNTISAASCAIDKHEYSDHPTQSKHAGKDPFVQYLMYNCKLCGQAKYTKLNIKTGEETVIEQSEYDHLVP